MPDLTKAQPGLLARHPGETHLYHASKDPLVVYTAEDMEKALKDGYSTEYVPREYPKHVTRQDGVTVVVNNEAEEKAATEAE